MVLLFIRHVVDDGGSLALLMVGIKLIFVISIYTYVIHIKYAAV